MQSRSVGTYWGISPTPLPVGSGGELHREAQAAEWLKDLIRRSASYIDKILKDAQPSPAVTPATPSSLRPRWPIQTGCVWTRLVVEPHAQGCSPHSPDEATILS